MLLTLIIFIVLLSLLIFVHELGHYLTAIKFGVKVEEFGLGFPPRIFGWQIYRQKKIVPLIKTEEISVDIEMGDENRPVKEIITDEKKEINVLETTKTWRWFWGNKSAANSGPVSVSQGESVSVRPDEPTVYSLNWIPLGGFVKIKGEDGGGSDNSDSFVNKSIGRRILILAAGVIMNLLFCAGLLFIGFSVGLPASLSGNSGGGQIISQPKIQVMETVKDMPAEAAGVKAGDIIVSWDNQEFKTIPEIQAYLASKKDQTVLVKINRGGSEINLPVAVKEYQDRVGIGVSLVETGIVRYPWHLALWQAIKTTGAWLMLMVMTLTLLIKNLIFGLPSGVELAGPVGIAVLTGDAVKLGWIYLLQFAAFLSLNLALINILPIPALDGGRILFLIIEKIRGQAIKQKWENLVHNLGFILLMALIVLVTYRDILRYGGKIIGVFSRSVGL